MHCIEKIGLYVMEPSPCKPLPMAIGAELTAVLKSVSPDSKYRVDIRIDGPLHRVAVDELRGQLSYYGHTLQVFPGTTEVEIITGGSA
jgi:hypothetical protein